MILTGDFVSMLLEGPCRAYRLAKQDFDHKVHGLKGVGTARQLGARDRWYDLHFLVGVISNSSGCWGDSTLQDQRTCE